MKSILIAGVSLMTSLKWAFLRRSMQHQIIAAKAACLLIASIASIPAQAGTIGISYSSAGGPPTAPPVISGTTLTLDSLATGSFLSDNPSLNALWNPFTIRNHHVANLITGIGNAASTITFADGDLLFGDLVEDDSALLAGAGMGPFTNILTFTGGTGEFAGATGSLSGRGVSTTAGFTASGSGTLTAPRISSVPEPASVALIFGSLLVIAAKRKLVRGAFDYKRKKQ